MRKCISIIAALVMSLGAFAQQPLVFGPPTTIHADTSFTSEVLGMVDIDNDGDLDAAADFSQFFGFTYGLFICENDGSGNFQVKQFIEMIFQGYSFFSYLTGQDMDNDGDADIVGLMENINTGQPTIVLFDNDGSGNYTWTESVGLNGPVNNIQVLDFDMDGDNDVMAYQSFGSQLFFNRNDGAGNFELFSVIGLPSTHEIFFADIDEDNDMDAFSSDNPNLLFHENNGTDTIFESSVIYQDGNAVVVEAVDLDQSGSLDIIYRRYNVLASCLYNDGSNSFSLAAWSIIESLMGFVHSIDMDSDGLPDLLYEIDGEVIKWNRNLGTTFEFPANIAYEGHNAGVFTMDLADLNGDGHLDIYSIIDQYAAWFGNNQDGTFSAPEYIATNARQPFLGNTEDLDLDGDAEPIVIYTPYIGQEFQPEAEWHENLGGAGFGPHTDLVRSSYFNDDILKLQLPMSDVDGDGDADIVTTLFDDENPGNDTIDIGWYENLGNGQFGAFNLVDRKRNAYKMELADLDGDLDEDILIYFSESNDDEDQWMAWYPNQGGNFGPPNLFAMGQDPVNFYVVDIEPDGDMDIVTTEWDNSFGLWANDGIGQFVRDELDIVLNEDAFPTTFGFADMDLDGDPDYVAAAEWTDQFGNYIMAVFWYANEGVSQTWPLGHLKIIDEAIPWSGINSRLSDIDLDGDPDILSPVFLIDAAINWLENDGSGILSDPKLLTPVEEGFGVLMVNAEDLDNDGDLDLISGPDLFGNIFMHENLTDSKDIIRAFVFLDSDEDGKFDEGEYGLDNQTATVQPGNITLVSDYGGQMAFHGDSGVHYIVTLDTVPGWTLTSDSLSYHVTLPGEPGEELQFGIYPDNTFIDIDLSIISAPTTCVEPLFYYLTYTNAGTSPVDGYVDLILIPEADFLSSSPDADEINGDTLRWEFDNLIPGQSNYIVISASVTDIELIGDTINILSNLYLQDSSETELADFSTGNTSVFLCSYDPNDKLVQPPGVGEDHLTLLDETLTYTVRFQNTGNFPAFNVTIKDVIDDHLDLSTLRVVHQSHTMTTTIDQTSREVTFFFPNIMLPDSTSDPEGSNGFVTYSIDPLEVLEENTIVENTADIIFDINPPITTNTVFNTYVETIGTQNPTAVVYFEGQPLNVSIFPNPASRFTHLHLEGGEHLTLDIEILDLSGRSMNEWKGLSGPLIKLPVSYLAPGVYIVNIRPVEDSDFIQSFKLMKN